MVKELEPYWDDGNRDAVTERFAPAWTDQSSLDDLVGKIVHAPPNRPYTIEHMEIPDLRALIVAVQRQPDALLTKLDPQTKKPLGVFDQNGNRVNQPPSLISISGGEISQCNCLNTRIGCSLNLHTRFVTEANFRDSHFAARAWFSESYFAAEASFTNSHFADKANFIGACFEDDVYFRNSYFAEEVYFYYPRFNGKAIFGKCHFNDKANFQESQFATIADFWQVHFADIADFESSCFKDKANFWGSRFDNKASFIQVYFAGDAIFLGTIISNSLKFSSATIERQLMFAAPGRLSAKFLTYGRLRVNQIIVRSGAMIELSSNLLKLLVPLERTRLAHQREWYRGNFTFVYFIILRCIYQPITNWLGLGQRGRLVMGEDSDNAEKLIRAVEDYNRLRDFFRNQPSTDEQEVICNFKYLDLKRRARWARSKNSWHEWCWEFLVAGWDWLIQRNALGYLVQTHRIVITGLFLIVMSALIYYICGGDSIVPNLISEGYHLGFRDAVYFSLVTFTSLGYGDLHPVGWMKIFSAGEALLGLTLMALFTVSWARKMIR